MKGRPLQFVTGFVAGIAAMVAIGATKAPSAIQGAKPARSVEIVLHRFDMVPGKGQAFREWINFLHARHREAVATLARERTYFEAMFTAPDEPGRLYWITVQGAGGANVESSTLDLDRQHVAYMNAILAKGSHRRLTTQNVLAPDFIVHAVGEEQRREDR